MLEALLEELEDEDGAKEVDGRSTEIEGEEDEGVEIVEVALLVGVIIEEEEAIDVNEAPTLFEVEKGSDNPLTPAC